MPLVTDHYRGFEGEPEIVFRTSDNKSGTWLWAGYFDAIAEAIRPNAHGRWEGLALIYHAHTGWYEESPFLLTDLTEVIRQLRGSGSSAWSVALQLVYADLLAFFQLAEARQQAVMVDYF